MAQLTYLLRLPAAHMEAFRRRASLDGCKLAAWIDQAALEYLARLQQEPLAAVVSELGPRPGYGGDPVCTEAAEEIGGPGPVDGWGDGGSAAKEGGE